MTGSSPVRRSGFTRTKCVFLLAVLLWTAMPRPGLAHSLSETVQLSNRYAPLLKTDLTLDLFDEFSLSAIYSSNLKFGPKGGEVLAEYYSYSGVAAWLSAGYFTEEQLITGGGGHQKILEWPNGSWGLTGTFGRSQLNTGTRQAKLVQWQAGMTTLAQWDYGWNASLGFTHYFYNLTLSRELWEQAQLFFEDQQSLKNLLFVDFIVFYLSASLGYDWIEVGYISLTGDMTGNWDNSNVFSGQLTWEREIFEPITLEATGQYTSRNDLLVGLRVKCDF